MLKASNFHFATAIAVMTGTAMFAVPTFAWAQPGPGERAITRSLNMKTLQTARAQEAAQMPGATHATAKNSTQHDADEISKDDSNDAAPGNDAQNNNGASSEMPQMEPDHRTIPLTPGEPGAPYDDPDTPQ